MVGCFVKKLPFSENAHARFLAAEGVLQSKLDSSVRSDITKTAQPWSGASPMKKKSKKSTSASVVVATAD